MSGQAQFRRLTLLFKQWLERKASKVNHRAVIKDIYQEVDISAGYFLILTLANLIALSGLITNNTAVIIGAMLISPLMGPILSSGFAFITGDALIGRKAIRKLVLSIAVTIFVAAVATWVSPLKDVTAEIIARTRPNLYDLAIAFFAGMAGAIALCTKKNYMTVVPGVAIATAVIPPLSVAGFGLGTGKLMVAMGGFFLFFTNFVAIVVCTCVVFYIYGFRVALMTDEVTDQMKKRLVMLGVLLVVISIPLVYTLLTSISAVRTSRSVELVLRQELDKEYYSRLVSVNQRRGKDNKLEVTAVVNTVAYLKEEEVVGVEKALVDALKQDVVLDVQQVQVRAGRLKDEAARPGILPGVAPPRIPEQTSRTSIEGAVGVARRVSEKMEKIISPSGVTGFHVGFIEGDPIVSVLLRLKRDEPVTEEQRRWLRQILSTELDMPVELTVETTPHVPPLVFRRSESALTVEMKKALTVLKEVNRRGMDVHFVVEGHPGDGSALERNASKKRMAEVRKYLIGEVGIPEDIIKTVLGENKAEPMVKISVTASGSVVR